MNGQKRRRKSQEQQFCKNSKKKTAVAGRAEPRMTWGASQNVAPKVILGSTRPATAVFFLLFFSIRLMMIVLFIFLLDNLCIAVLIKIMYSVFAQSVKTVIQLVHMFASCLCA